MLSKRLEILQGIGVSSSTPVSSMVAVVFAKQAVIIGLLKTISSLFGEAISRTLLASED